MAIKSENGIHPKHRLINYHSFFVSNINPGDKVLDIGCGNGALSYDISLKAKEVFAVDIENEKISKARFKYGKENIKYLVGDATKIMFDQKFDVIILSNVLEHIQDRISFLRSIRDKASKFLIRVPMFDRDWVVAYKKDLGIEWRLDKTHYIEYTEDSFKSEINSANLNVNSINIKYGEILAVVYNK